MKTRAQKALEETEIALSMHIIDHVRAYELLRDAIKDDIADPYQDAPHPKAPIGEPEETEGE